MTCILYNYPGFSGTLCDVCVLYNYPGFSETLCDVCVVQLSRFWRDVV